MERIELGGFDAPMDRPMARMDGGADEGVGLRIEGQPREGMGMRLEPRPRAEEPRMETRPIEDRGMPSEAGVHEGAAVRLDAVEGRGSRGETHVYFGPGEQNKTVTVADGCDALNSAGRVLDVEVKLGRVSPGRRVALGISVNEVDKTGREHSRGFRSVTVPAHREKGCREVTVPVVRFILPEDLRTDGHEGMCSGRRHFIIRTNAQYVDGNAEC